MSLEFVRTEPKEGDAAGRPLGSQGNAQVNWFGLLERFRRRGGVH